ncbi:MAG: tyrosine-type recombinase/integrase [Clostridia bacterium]|nr:tyrosine-type recombinase/integrase [Clostridia bacterium]
MSKTKSRGNGQGTAYKRGKTWEACVTIRMVTPEDPAKKPYPLKRRKGGFPTKAAAIAYCPILLAGGVEKKTQAPRLSEYWQTYQDGEFAKLSSSKQSADRTAWKKIKPIHDVRVDCITVDLLRRTVSDACPTYDPAKDCKSVLSNLFALAGADRFADKDLPSFIVLPSHEEKETIPFNDLEQAALWRLYESGDKRAAIPLLMIYTGMMPGEAQKLRVENIDLAARTITHAGIKTKVHKATRIVISASILPLVEDLIANARSNGFLWKRNEKEWYEAYYAALEAAGCRRLAPYSCRHTTATALAIDKNIAPQTIKRVMRWSTTKMLDRYAHPEMSDALSAVDTIKKTCG